MDDILGTLTGIATFVVLMIFGVNFCVDQWHEDVNSARHQKHWRVHTGSVLSVSEPDLSNSPPDRPALVSYPDYYGQKVKVDLHLPYGTHVSDSVGVDVSRDGSIYVPGTTDWVNQIDHDPFKASHKFWPAAGIILVAIPVSLIGSLLFGFGSALLFEYIADERRRRKEERRPTVWSKEELKRREKDVGL